MEVTDKKPELAIPLTEREVPGLVSEQLSKFTRESIGAKEAQPIEIALPEGQSVLSVDIGGDSLVAAVVSVINGRLERGRNVVNVVGSKLGRDYLRRLEWAASYAKQYRLPVGISFAGPVAGSKPQHGENVPVLMRDLREKYSGDFAALFPTFSVLENDAPAGLLAGALYAQQQEVSGDIIYAINGSGLNAAALAGGSVISAEAGHVELVDELNPYNQQNPCHLHDDKFVCIESVAASKAGIEDLWEKQTGRLLDGKEIEQQYLAGDELAGNLYDHSALVTSHMVAGVARALGIDLKGSSTAVIGHGGTFKFPGYGARVQQILATHMGAKPHLFMTKDFSQNACLEGAALAALAKAT